MNSCFNSWHFVAFNFKLYDRNLQDGLNAALEFWKICKYRLIRPTSWSSSDLLIPYPCNVEKWQCRWSSQKAWNWQLKQTTVNYWCRLRLISRSHSNLPKSCMHIKCRKPVIALLSCQSIFNAWDWINISHCDTLMFPEINAKPLFPIFLPD